MAAEKCEPKIVVQNCCPRWRFMGNHRRLNLRTPRTDAAVGALRGDRQGHHRNSRCLGNDVILSDTLRATTDFAEAANCADVVVMGVPSHGFRGVLTELSRELRPWVPVVSLVKGLEQGTNMRMSQIIEEVLPGHPAGILAGPNIAREVAEGRVGRGGAGNARPASGNPAVGVFPHPTLPRVHHRRRRRG